MQIIFLPMVVLLIAPKTFSSCSSFQCGSGTDTLPKNMLPYLYAAYCYLLKLLVCGLYRPTFLSLNCLCHLPLFWISWNFQHFEFLNILYKSSPPPRECFRAQNNGRQKFDNVSIRIPSSWRWYTGTYLFICLVSGNR